MNRRRIAVAGTAVAAAGVNVTAGPLSEHWALRWWIVTVSLVLATASLDWWLTPATEFIPARPVSVECTATELAKQVLRLWETEAVVRSLNDPAPMPVQWRLLADVSDGSKSETKYWEACSGEIGELTRRFRAMHKRRLVIVGDAGSGKTTLAVQLLLDLLEKRIEGEPVPVLLPVAGWDTTRFPRLHDWLVYQLPHHYPALRSDAHAPLVPALVADGHILPVLDGLDELPRSARAAAISALNGSMRDRDQIILTSRTDEFTSAVATSRVINSSAVLQAEPLLPAQAADYLCKWRSPEPGSAWAEIIDRLGDTPVPDPRTEPEEPWARLAAITATPLGLWLLRTVYGPRADGHTAPDPTPLIASARYSTIAQLRDHLYEHLASAIVTSRTRGGKSNSQLEPRHHRQPEEINRRLAWLADRLAHPAIAGGQEPARDLGWWQLSASTLTPARMGLAGALSVGLMFGLAGALQEGQQAGLIFGLLGALVGWLVVHRVAPSWLQDEPAYANLNLRGRGRELTRQLAGRLWTALISGLVSGLASGVFTDPAGGLIASLLFGVVAGFLGRPGPPAFTSRVRTPTTARRSGRIGAVMRPLTIGLVFALASAGTTSSMRRLLLWLAGAVMYQLAVGFIGWAEQPVPTDDARTPTSSWKGDRTLVILRVLTLGFVLGFITGLARGPLAGVATGVVFGVVTGTGGGRHHAWWSYAQATMLGGRNRRLPGDLMGFLDDAHRLGLLRTIGPLYQFRHADMQDYFAAQHAAHAPDPTKPERI